ncbi:hypothetical protein [Desulfitobacterium chlororespirans]|uniref:Uncharacterized protein n=1 Tax=Desulfitobacterium chlororespirans DSM 11544 TaxID=1121395 RepID=A0A1M7U2C4_9FIRM|nr:hypothetical protein [Desulfitobacterium chlororespirans]SHN77149.1 hypothetical protein SAMN02745215_02848 [Desulfitobacterium chlororespirans DSM 11544]
MGKYINKEILDKKRAESLKDQQIQDLELALADQMAKNVELEQRQQDTELLLADILAGGVM